MPIPAESVSRRQFLSTAAVTTAAVTSAAILGAPMVSTASKTDKPLIVGEGEYSV